MILYKKFNSLLMTTKSFKASIYDFEAMLKQMERFKILELIENAKERKKVIISADSEDIVYGMKDDAFFKTHGHLNFIMK